MTARAQAGGLAEEFRAATAGASVPALRKATAAFWKRHQGTAPDVFSALRGLWDATTAGEDRSVRLGIAMVCGPIAAVGVPGAMEFLTTTCAGDSDWRLQEALAKGFDWMCETIGWQRALPVIGDWIGHRDANVRRAASEGPRVWTKRDYFASRPEAALELLGRLRADSSPYVRKSVANAVSDISKTHPDRVLETLATWAAGPPDASWVITNASRHLKKTHPDRLAALLDGKGT